MSPIVPPPRTATSAASVPRAIACTQAASGSAIAAPAKSRPSGIACSAADGAAMRSAKPPSTQVGARQIAARPARHGPQVAAGHGVAHEDALAGVGAHAGGLVAEARRVVAQDPVAVAQHLAVGAARGGRPHLDQHLAGGLVDLLDAQVVGAVEHRRAHHAGAPVRSSAARTRGTHQPSSSRAHARSAGSGWMTALWPKIQP